MNETKANHDFIDCEGYLYKTGGRGHTIKNQKKRYFILRGLFLSYYTTNPKNSQSKGIELLKGHIFLPGCKLSDIYTRNNKKYFIFTNRMFKEFIFTSIHDDTHQNNKEIITSLETWHQKLSKSIDDSTSSLLNDSINGSFFWKCKDQKNWKKRFFILKGNILFYFSTEPKIEDLRNGLKGWIDLFEVKNITKKNDQQKPSFLIETNVSNVYTIQHEDQSLIDKWFLHLSNQLKKIKLESPQEKLHRKGLSKGKNHKPSIVKRKKTIKEGNIIHYTHRDFNLKELASILHLFHSLKITDKEIWNCPLIVMKILLHYSSYFINSLQDIAKKFPLEIELHHEEKNHISKVFIVNPLSRIDTLKHKICSHLMIDNDHEYVIMTLDGSILDDHHYIGVYGFGTLFKGWKLKLKKKIEESINQPQITMNECNISNQYPILIVSYDITFDKYPFIRIYVNPQWSPIDILKKLNEKAPLGRYDDYYLTNSYGKILSNDISLGSIGLGERFDVWTLYLFKKEQNGNQIDDDNNKNKRLNYLWVQYDESVTLEEAKDIIYSLEYEMNEKMEMAKDTVINLRQKLDDMNIKMKKLEIENDILRMNMDIKERMKEKENIRNEDVIISEIDKMIDHLDKVEYINNEDEKDKNDEESIFIMNNNNDKKESKDHDFYNILMSHLNDIESSLKPKHQSITPLNIKAIKELSEHEDIQTNESNEHNISSSSSKQSPKLRSSSPKKKVSSSPPGVLSPRTSSPSKQSPRRISPPKQSPRKSSPSKQSPRAWKRTSGSSSPRSSLKKSSNRTSSVSNKDIKKKKTSTNQKELSHRSKKTKSLRQTQSMIKKNQYSSFLNDESTTDLYNIIIDLEKKLHSIDLSSAIDIQIDNNNESTEMILKDIIV